MTDDKKNKMVNKGDKEAKKVTVEHLKGVAAGWDNEWHHVILPSSVNQEREGATLSVRRRLPSIS